MNNKFLLAAALTVSFSAFAQTNSETPKVIEPMASTPTSSSLFFVQLVFASHLRPSAPLRRPRSLRRAPGGAAATGARMEHLGPRAASARAGGRSPSGRGMVGPLHEPPAVRKCRRGILPLEFDDLVRESFSELIQAA